MRRPALYSALRRLRFAHLLVLLGLAAVSGCAGSKDSTAYGSDLAHQGPNDGYSAPAEGQGASYGHDAPASSPGAGGAAAPVHEAESAADYDGRMSKAEQRAQNRPGLGTSYGEQRYSSVRNVEFQRKHRNRPEAVLSLWYDDWAGVEAAARRQGWQHPQWASASEGSNGLSVALLDEYGNTLSGGRVGNRAYAVGEPGARYMLSVHNGTGERYEVVASVDGLDVIDGEPGSYKKRGYVVEPWSSVQIDGWRTSDESVAAFRFSSIRDSYAGRKGKARNVGVIGFAFFAEDAPRYAEPPPPRPHYDHRRDHANPFPGR